MHEERLAAGAAEYGQWDLVEKWSPIAGPEYA